ncbi:MAG: hypothetical protein NVSMB13_21780 [Mycobacteriales bacterium]
MRAIGAARTAIAEASDAVVPAEPVARTGAEQVRAAQAARPDGAEDDGVAPAIGAAMDAVAECRSPTVALVHGEGGSGGAIAAAVTDVVLVTPASYFTAPGPAGAATALRVSADEAADRLAITPADLLRLGFADALVDAPTAGTAADLRAALAQRLDRLCAQPVEERLAARRDRWTASLPRSG